MTTKLYKLGSKKQLKKDCHTNLDSYEIGVIVLAENRRKADKSWVVIVNDCGQ